MPNNFAYLMLLIWPLISIALYKKRSILEATFGTIIGGLLLLPIGVQIDFPMLPAFDKNTIPAIMAFVGCRYVAKKRVSLLPPQGLERKLIIIFFIGCIATVLTNGDPVEETGRYIPGLTYRDVFSVVMAQCLLVLPFSLAIQLIKTPEDQIKIFKLLVAAGLIYSVLILFELRMSPQLHRWVYGYFPYTWGQHVRHGGFRPVVFLGHGLWVSIFILTVLGAALTLMKLKIKMTKPRNGLVILYLVGLLILAKGFGATILGLVLLVGIVVLSSSIANKLAIAIAIVAITYPLLCVMDVFPHNYLVEIFDAIDPLQAGSLAFRFEQEASLLSRTMGKIIFGWGAWGRNRLPDSVVDGYWISLISMYGAIGFTQYLG